MTSVAGGMNPRAVALTIAVATVGVLPAFLTGGLAVQITSELGFGAAPLGIAIALFFTSAASSSIFMGRLVERIGSHGGMRLAAAIAATAMLGVAVLGRSWLSLVIFLIVGGLANAMSHPAANLSLAREIPPGRRAFSFGIKQAAIPTATLLGGLAVPVLATTIGWRWAFVVGAVVALALIPAVPKEELALVPKPKERGRPDSRTRALVLLALGIGLGSTAATPLGSFVVSWAVESGMDVNRAGLLLAAGSAFSIVVRVVFGHLADGMKEGRLRIVAFMLGCGVAGYALLATGIPTAIVFGTLIAFAAGWGWPGLFNFAVVKSNPSAPAAATGITQTGASAGAALGPLIFGIIAQTTSYTVGWIVCGAIAVASLLAIVSGRAMLVRHRSEPKTVG